MEPPSPVDEKFVGCGISKMWHYCCILTTTVNDMPTVSDLTVWLVSLDRQQRHLADSSQCSRRLSSHHSPRTQQK